MKDIKVDRLTVLGTGANGSIGNTIIGANEQIRATTGVDLVAAARQAVSKSGA
jgi:hypothetical protein